jgi:hypothetical protein
MQVTPVAHSSAPATPSVEVPSFGAASSTLSRASPRPVEVPAVVVDKFCLPPVVAACGARRSARHAATNDGSTTTDEDMMIKAMRRKATKNLDFSGMDTPSSSFIPLSTPVLSSKLSFVGISLGKNYSEINVSANVLRRMEFDRLTRLAQSLII